MAEIYSEEVKEKWVMFFLLKYDHFRPARLSKDKINTSIAKFWDNNLFWDAFLKNFNLLDLAPGSKVPDNIHQAVIVFWSIIKDGLNYEEKQAKAKEKAKTKLSEILSDKHDNVYDDIGW